MVLVEAHEACDSAIEGPTGFPPPCSPFEHLCLQPPASRGDERGLIGGVVDSHRLRTVALLHDVSTGDPIVP